jgi:hypothetical protein
LIDHIVESDNDAVRNRSQAPVNIGGLKTEPPHLLFTVGDEERLGGLIAADPFLSDLAYRVEKHATWFLHEPVIAHNLKGPRLLQECRCSLARIFTLSLAYRLCGKSAFADRAVLEMKAAARLPDWNPSHFLDTAELSFGVAIGLDWLASIMTEADRQEITGALIEKSLRPALSFYPDDGFAGKFNNWNFVCNGSLIIAALAVAEDVTDLAQSIIDYAWAALSSGLAMFAPEGAWFEGPTYWSYGTHYLFLLIRCLERGFGSDFGLSGTEGLAGTGEFFVHAIGPTGQCFNYADCGSLRPGSTPQLAWLARQYEKPFLDRVGQGILIPVLDRLDEAEKCGTPPVRVLYNNRLLPLELLWRDVAIKPVRDREMPPSQCLRGTVDLAFLRTSWDRDASYIGFKGGRNFLNHAHLDCGNFVYEALGERWIEDLGGDHYDLPGYFDYAADGRRWGYLRISSRGHNVLTCHSENQRVPGRGAIVAFAESRDRAFAIADLRDAYRGYAKRVRRGVCMFDGGAVVIRDEIEASTNGEVWTSGFITSAEIELDCNEAILRLNGRRLLVCIVEPAEAVFTVGPLIPENPEESANEGSKILSVKTGVAVGADVVLAVSMMPQELSNGAGGPVGIPLSRWPGNFPWRD